MNNVSVSKQADCFDDSVEVIVVGAGACGLIAALRALDKGADVLVLERDSSPTGSTSLSSGFIPAGGTRFQKRGNATGVNSPERNISSPEREINSPEQGSDSPEEFAKDIQAKSHGLSLRLHVQLACNNIAEAMEWLADEHGVPWIVLDDFLYPGHRFHRMHTVPEKTGEALQARLLTAAHRQALTIATDSRVVSLYTDPERTKVTGVDIVRPDGKVESIGCSALILACNGYGGNKDMVECYIPEIARGLYFGHPGNTGEAVLWGQQLDAEMAHLSGYQGHGSVAHPHGMLITWALMMEGGVQVNLEGKRFSNEHGGYSEQAVNVLAQTSQLAWNIYDSRIHRFAKGFPDYVQACHAGAIRHAETIEELCETIDIPFVELAKTLRAVDSYRGGSADPLGRNFTGDQALQAPWYAVKVTGALFHTQGGLVLDNQCRVRRANGSVFENLFAGGGAACGVSGPEVSGYLSGNGLLTAVAFGYIAGGKAADAVLRVRV